MSLIKKSDAFKGSKLHKELMKLTPDRLALLKTVESELDIVDRQVALSRKLEVVQEARAIVKKLQSKAKNKEESLSEVMNWLYDKKYTVYADTENPNINNITRYVNNAEDKFGLSETEKKDLEGYMPGYLERFATWYDEEMEDLSAVVCASCGYDKYGEIVQCDYCGIWMCNLCAGKPADEIPNGKKHHDPNHQDKWGCGVVMGLTDFVGEGYINLKHEEFKSHSALYAPVFDSKANKKILKQMDKENLDAAIAQVYQEKYNRNREKLGDDHQVQRRKKRYILDNSDDEEHVAEKEVLEITNGEPVPQKECVPDMDVPGVMKFRKKWTVEKWYKKIEKAAKSIEEEPYLVLGMNQHENDVEFVKLWHKEFLMTWHDDTIKEVLTPVQKEMVHEMLPMFISAKKIFIGQIESKNIKQDDKDKKLDNKKLKKKYRSDSDSD